jgi:hypothetical protein
MSILKLTLLGLALLGGLYLLDRLALWAERRGWIFYRKVKPSGNALGSTALELQKIFESGKATHVIKAQQEQGKDRPDPGSGHP